MGSNCVGCTRHKARLETILLLDQCYVPLELYVINELTQ